DVFFCFALILYAHQICWAMPLFRVVCACNLIFLTILVLDYFVEMCCVEFVRATKRLGDANVARSFRAQQNGWAIPVLREVLYITKL
ncbi:MAG: hypothetical protein ACFB10_11440, partial [Salibacteraceae bacterium]